MPMGMRAGLFIYHAMARVREICPLPPLLLVTGGKAILGGIRMGELSLHFARAE